MNAKEKVCALRLGSLQAKLSLSPEQFRHKVIAGNVQEWPGSNEIAEFETRLRRSDIRLSFPGQAWWPFSSTSLSNPPLLFYLRGCALPKGPGLAVVGSRTASDYALRTTRRVVERWASVQPDGHVITGGGMGVDLEAMKVGLQMGIPVLVVLASGVDCPRPKANGGVFEKVLQQGVLISENFPGGPCYPSVFPYRNRLIPALASQLIVIRAARKSGSFHSLRYAHLAEKGGWGVVGPIDDPGYQGIHEAIRRKWVRPFFDLDDLGPNPRKQGLACDGRRSNLDPWSQKAISILLDNPMGLNELSFELGISSSVASRLMLRLELTGHVLRDRDNSYRVPNS